MFTLVFGVSSKAYYETMQNLFSFIICFWWNA